MRTRRPAASSFVALSMLLFVIEAGARPTPEQKCQAGKNIAAGRFAACLQSAEAKLATTGDAAKYAKAKLDCSYKFATRWLKLEATAARIGATCPDEPLDPSALEAAIKQCSASVASVLAGSGITDCTSDLATCVGDLGACNGTLDICQADLATCQAWFPTPTATPAATATPTPVCTPISGGTYTDNCDGTVTDTQTGLQWEKKTGAAGDRHDCSVLTTSCPFPHDVNNTYQWCLDADHNNACDNGSSPDGGLFTNFLAKLNADEGFAGHTDWRIPTKEELETILLEPHPCGTHPCIDSIFGPQAADPYATTTTFIENPLLSWRVHFSDGNAFHDSKFYPSRVRAVRGGF